MYIITVMVVRLTTASGRNGRVSVIYSEDLFSSSTLRTNTNPDAPSEHLVDCDMYMTDDHEVYLHTTDCLARLIFPHLTSEVCQHDVSFVFTHAVFEVVLQFVDIGRRIAVAVQVE